MTMIAVEAGGRFTEVPALVSPAAAPPGAVPAGGPAAGLEVGAGALGFEVFARLDAGMRRMADAMDREQHYRLALAQAIYPLPIDVMQIPLTAGAGVLDLPQLLRPTLGRYWDVKTISATGFSAGTVAVYINGVGLASRGVITSATLPLFYGKGQCALKGNSDRLVFVAAGITGTVSVSVQVVHVADPFAGEYFR
jgi:hypothetical protein